MVERNGRPAALIRAARSLAVGGLSLSVNIRGELFTTVATFLASAVLRLASSLILTRLLYPEAYGVVAAIASILFVIEMLSDVGVIGLLIRHERGNDQAFINTLWTFRLARSVVNAAVTFFAAPSIAHYFGDSSIADPLRVVSVLFLLGGLSSMAFPLAMRDQRSRIVSFVDLACNAVSTVFVIAYSYFSRDYWGMVFGMVLDRGLHTLASYAFYRDRYPRFAVDQDALRAAFSFAKFVMPTSILTMALSQFERIALPRLFDLKLLGIYGVGAGVAAPIEALLSRLCQLVLYPRCTAAFRTAPLSLRDCFYRDNVKLLLVLAALPPLIGGAGQQIVHVLYDNRYQQAGFIVQVLMIRLSLLSIVRPCESLLVATGDAQAPLIANAARLIWLVPGSLLGYWIYGFQGFMLVAAMDALPAALYLLSAQQRRGLLFKRFELARLGFMAACWVTSYAGAYAIGAAWQAIN